MTANDVIREGFRERLEDYWHLGLHQVLRRAPIDAASDLGSLLVRRNVKRNLPHIITGARHNLRRLKPDWSDDEVEVGVQRFLDNVGRVYAEFSLLHRLIAEGRVSFNPDKFRTGWSPPRPMVMVMLHTGNWEVFPAALSHLGLPINSFYLPPEPAVHNAIVQKVRAELGVTLLHPGPRGVREALRLLRSARPFAIFGDDARGGETMAPLFGRPPHEGGNLGLVSRFARSCDAELVVCHCVRLHKSRFELHAGDIFRLSDAAGPNGTVLDDIAYLNTLIEPIIRAHADQWYFLDDRF
ncbi:hypothetical protein KHC28_12260 [Ancylobacter sonchi]|uniref:lysophospholipid acyltransferase family protein n=1 Tax=Ancylobacter sonchi TaxID=1937790 RepID=UPI001BD2C68F|nr:hypothetical protein [Ancylobacter sonchi]MBS7534431.1 hypothetical protein [Ancylobacter sonchi]